MIYTSSHLSSVPISMARLQHLMQVQPRNTIEAPTTGDTSTSPPDLSATTTITTTNTTTASSSNILTVTNLSYTILPATPCTCTPTLSPKTFPILKSISFSAGSSRLTAVLGPSGAGKSTLLRAISGRAANTVRFDPTSISLNGHPATTTAHLRKLCGFVTQEDNLLPRLTIRETLAFASRFRLRGLGATEREERVARLIEDFGLAHVADSYVGDAGEARGISGGERRRVSIAVEAMHDPPVLLLDEPTSGLDSASALRVVELLAGMARARQQVVVLTMHQPGYRMVQYLSGYLLLSRGAVAHHGNLRSLEERIARMGLKVPKRVGALEFAMEISRILEEWWQQSSRRVDGLGAVRRVEYWKEKSGGGGGRGGEELRYLARWEEVSSLAWRYWRVMYRTRQLFLARAMQAIVGGLGLGSVYLRLKPDERGVADRLGLFAFTLSFLLSSTVEALPLFLHERKVLMKEVSRGMYRVSSYLAANTLVFVPFLLAVSVLFSVPLYWLVGLYPSVASFLFFTLMVWMIFMMASSLVLFLGASCPDLVLGNSMIGVVLGVFFLFSGYFIPRESIPKYWEFMYYVSPYRYPLDALLVNEYWESRDRCFSFGSDRRCVLSGGDVLRSRGLVRDVRWENAAIMVGFFALYRVLSWVVLVRKASKTML